MPCVYKLCHHNYLSNCSIKIWNWSLILFHLAKCMWAILIKTTSSSMYWVNFFFFSWFCCQTWKPKSLFFYFYTRWNHLFHKRQGEGESHKTLWRRNWGPPPCQTISHLQPNLLPSIYTAWTTTDTGIFKR